MRIFRIGDERHPIWDGVGAALVGGRWNSPGKPVIYGSLSYSCAMLEILAHANIGRIPTTHRLVIAEVPTDVSIEHHDGSILRAGWDTEVVDFARVFGDQWLREARSAILVVPSVVAKLDWNALVNPLHPDAAKLTVAAPEKIIWDKRLFERTHHFKDSGKGTLSSSGKRIEIFLIKQPMTIGWGSVNYGSGLVNLMCRLSHIKSRITSIKYPIVLICYLKIYLMQSRRPVILKGC